MQEKEFNDLAHEVLSEVLSSLRKVRIGHDGVQELSVPKHLADKIVNLATAHGTPGTAIATAHIVNQAVHGFRQRKAYFESLDPSVRESFEGEIRTLEVMERVASAYYAAAISFFAASLTSDQVARSRLAALAAKAKTAKSPSAPAKHAALTLWPEASRKGWTAVQFHTELVRRGHSVAPDTARKWLTSLRKTGEC